MTVKSELEVRIPLTDTRIVFKQKVVPEGKEFTCRSDQVLPFLRVNPVMIGLRLRSPNVFGVYERDHTNEPMNNYLKSRGDAYHIGTVPWYEINKLRIADSVLLYGDMQPKHKPIFTRRFSWEPDE